MSYKFQGQEAVVVLASMTSWLLSNPKSRGQFRTFVHKKSRQL
jgi:hypothetical protein